METLLYFAFLAGIYYLMVRSGGCAHKKRDGAMHAPDAAGKSTGQPFAWTAPEKDVDPVCGETVRTASAKPSVHDGKIYYFCSRDCREIFETAPGSYPGGGVRNPELEHSHA